MSLLKKLFYNDTESVQDTFNEDSEGVGGEVENVISGTEETTNERE